MCSLMPSERRSLIDPHLESEHAHAPRVLVQFDALCASIVCQNGRRSSTPRRFAGSSSSLIGLGSLISACFCLSVFVVARPILFYPVPSSSVLSRPPRCLCPAGGSAWEGGDPARRSVFGGAKAALRGASAGGDRPSSTRAEPGHGGRGLPDADRKGWRGGSGEGTVVASTRL